MMELKQCQSASWGRRLVLLCVVILSASVVFAGSHKMSKSLKGLSSLTTHQACHTVRPLRGILPSGSPTSSRANQACDAAMAGDRADSDAAIVVMTNGAK